MKRGFGFWFLFIIAVLLVVMMLLGQTMAFIDYEFTESIGLQEPVSLISEIGKAVNQAFGIGDTVIYLPLLVIGLIGLWMKKIWGVFVMFGALAITVYWPIVCSFIFILAQGAPGYFFTEYLETVIIILLIALYGIWGMYYIYRNRDRLVD
ncbi:hypothetical protein ACFLYK_01985 [Candidatus Cloacimonadota bacterium]